MSKSEFQLMRVQQITIGIVRNRAIYVDKRNTLSIFYIDAKFDERREKKKPFTTKKNSFVDRKAVERLLTCHLSHLQEKKNVR